MNIWIVSPRYAQDITDDAAIITWQFARYQEQQGHEVRVLAISCCCQSPPSSPICYRPRESLTPHLNSTAYWAWHMSQEILQAQTKGDRPDVVYVLTDWGLGHILLQEIWTLHPSLKNIEVITLPASPLLLTVKDNLVPRYRLDYWWAMEMERFTLRASTRVLSLSPAMNNALALSHPNSLNPFELLDPITEKATAASIHRLLMLGPIEPASHLDQWITALQPLWEQGFPYTLEVIGKSSIFSMTQSPYRDWIADKFPLAFTKGWIKFQDNDRENPVSEEILSSSLLLHGNTSPVLSWPLVLAAHASTPVLSLDSPRARELFDDDEKTIVPSVPELMQDMVQAKLASLSSPKNSQKQHKLRHPVGFTEAIETAQKMFPFVRPGDKMAQGTKSHQGRLSVVIPYYNLGSLIFDALDSIFYSRLIPDEVIVVDDGSDTPESIEALHGIARYYPVVQVIHTPNRGIVQARNLGAKKAANEFVALLDADDKYGPDYLWRCCEILETYPNVAFVGSWVQYFGENEGIWPGWNAEPPYVLYHNTINSSGIMIRRKALLDAGLNHDEMASGLEDYETIVHLITKGYRGVVIPEPLFYYRVRSNSRTQSNPHDPRWILLYDLIRQRHAETYAQYAEELMGLFNANGPQYRINSPLCPPGDFISSSLSISEDKSDDTPQP